MRVCLFCLFYRHTFAIDKEAYGTKFDVMTPVLGSLSRAELRAGPRPNSSSSYLSEVAFEISAKALDVSLLTIELLCRSSPRGYLLAKAAQTNNFVFLFIFVFLIPVAQP